MSPLSSSNENHWHSQEVKHQQHQDNDNSHKQDDGSYQEKGSSYQQDDVSYQEKHSSYQQDDGSYQDESDSSSLEELTPPPRRIERKSSFFDRLFQRKPPSPLIPSNNPSNETLPPLSPVNLIGYTSQTKHRLLDEELVNNIRDLLPPRLQLYDNWQLIYSNENDGSSLNTLYRHSDYKYQLKLQNKSKPHEIGYADDTINKMLGISNKIEPKRLNGYVLIIRDEDNDRFGCFLNENLKLMDNKRYYGNGECFLFKCERFIHIPHKTSQNDQLHNKKNKSIDKSKQTNDHHQQNHHHHHHHHHKSNDNTINHQSDNLHQIRFKAFKYTGVNDNIIYSNSNFIAIGSSNGQNGLYIDKSLSSGVSYRCDTFGNEVLNSSDEKVKLGKFTILNLEVWRIGDLD